MPEEVKVKEENSSKESLSGYLEKLTDKPTEQQKEAWKAEFGEIFVSGFSEKELFIWRPINRTEWSEMHSFIAGSETQLSELDIEEYVCEKCVLWPKDYNWGKGKAGTAHTLHEQIMSNSNFLSPAAAMTLVAKL